VQPHVTGQNKLYEASVIVFILPLEAALVEYNDSALFSAAPATDATRKMKSTAVVQALVFGWVLPEFIL